MNQICNARSFIQMKATTIKDNQQIHAAHTHNHTHTLNHRHGESHATTKMANDENGSQLHAAKAVEVVVVEEGHNVVNGLCCCCCCCCCYCCNCSRSFGLGSYTRNGCEHICVCVCARTSTTNFLFATENVPAVINLNATKDTTTTLSEIGSQSQSWTLKNSSCCQREHKNYDMRLRHGHATPLNRLKRERARDSATELMKRELKAEQKAQQQQQQQQQTENVSRTNHVTLGSTTEMAANDRLVDDDHYSNTNNKISNKNNCGDISAKDRRIYQNANARFVNQQQHVDFKQKHINCTHGNKLSNAQLVLSRATAIATTSLAAKVWWANIFSLFQAAKTATKLATQIKSHTTTTLQCTRCFKTNGDIKLLNVEHRRCCYKQQQQQQQQQQKKMIRAKIARHAPAQQQQQQQQQQPLPVSIPVPASVPVPVTLQQDCHWQPRILSIRTQVAKTIQVSRLLFTFCLLLMLSNTVNCWAGRQDAHSNCTFPARWEGSWFLSGYQQPIHIKGSQFSYRGKCAASDGNKYLIVDEKGCHRCLVIYEKHKNVLQYKESECEGDSMYLHQMNPSAMAMHSMVFTNQNHGGEHRGGVHPNMNGHSRLSSSDQFIMRSNDDTNDCPPDFCKGRETLQNLCDQIPGDALLYSLFRESAEPVKCPLKGPFVFTYNRGHGECKSPISNIESCTEESRLLLSFQACPDVQGTESTVEELTCLATWKDGNSRYLVGLVSHHHAISNEERFRCFVYEKISSMMGGPSIVNSKDAEYKLAQSGDATCNGLDSAEVGSRIMSLRKPPLAERCDFPVWFKGPRHWHALMGNAMYNYHSNDGSVHIIKSNGYMETRALCEQINKQTATEMMAVVHYTTGCQSGFMCMMFYRRDTHVIEIQTGKQASRLEDACASDYFDVSKTPYITLLASNPDPQICPAEGLYNLRGAIGPPYLATRHKRNHNNKLHSGHGHHHLSEATSLASGHRRHTTLSFRNADKIEEKSSWHANTRGLPVRSRRAISSTISTSAIIGTSQNSRRAHSSKTLVKRNEKSATLTLTSENHSINAKSNSNEATNSTALAKRLRNRRNAPPCITNVKVQRQLWVGCTEPNVIDVRPLCTDEGDEEYLCHGSWSENGTVYTIARHKGTKHGVCISYRPTEGKAAKLVIGDACYRGAQKPAEHHLVVDLTVIGKCGETGSSAAKLYLSWQMTTMTTMMMMAVTALKMLFGAEHWLITQR